jgi:hypothetical protein
MQFKNYLTLIVLVAFLGIQSSSFGSPVVWKAIGKDRMVSDAPNYIKPSSARYFELNVPALLQEFSSAPEEQKGKLSQYGKIVTLPMPDGSTQRFAIASYQMMEPGLRPKWNFIQTFLGQGLDDPTATLKADFTSLGFHYQILSSGNRWYADPVFHGDLRYYQVYDKKNLNPKDKGPWIEEGIDEPHIIDGTSGGIPTDPVFVSGPTLRTYRIAIATTGEYTNFHGGATNAASAVVTTLNRINGVYEREVAIRLVLVANNNLLIYTNSGSDPYTNNSGGTMLGQNQTNITTVIGTANYDMGHVFSTGGGGIAGLGVICSNNSKARGVTGSNSPVGDPFDIDYVAHEMGHQFGANHTFNSTTGSCGGNNRSAASAFEPGSGTTIMAYAGICGSDNTQNNSNDYFHFKSHEDIANYSQNGTGNSCPVKTQTGNSAPVIPALQGGFVIPISTPFKLTAPLVTDADNDQLTYCWEEFDLGPGGTPNSPTQDAPLFRSFLPVTSRERVFPRWVNILANSTTLGERLPTYARNLKFKLTVRDNKAGGGGVNSASMSMTVNATGGAFSVTSPNTNVAWEAGTSQTITWNAGATASAPFNSPLVRIKLSTDAGTSFPYILADSVANDGSQLVTFPVIPSTTCRVLIESIGNVFFDVSNVNFRLTAPTNASIAMSTEDTAVCAGQTFQVVIEPTGTVYNPGNVFSLQISNAAGQFVSPVTIGTIAGTSGDTITATIPPSYSGNTYKLRVVSSNPTRTSTQILNAPGIRPLPLAPGEISGVTSLCANDSTKWFSVLPLSGISGYSWQVPQGTQILSNPDSNAIRIRFGNTAGNLTVKAINSCGSGPGSSINLSPIIILPAQVVAVASTITPCQGTSVTFTANPTNGGQTPGYQWLKNDTIISGANLATYTTGLLSTGDKFKVILTSSLSCGLPNIDTSAQLTIQVNIPKTPTALIESNALNDTSCAGEAVTFTSTINTGGGTTPQYAWFRNLTQINGQTTSTLMLSNLTSNDSIRVRLSVAGNCLTTNQVFSPALRLAIIALNVNAGADTVVCPGKTASLNGLPEGGTWSGNGVNGSGTYTAGTTSGTSTLTYTVERYGCERSDTRVITIPLIPSVSYSVSINTLTAIASGATSWTWFRNDTIIPGANSASFVMPQSGIYCVEVKFQNGCTAKSPCLVQTVTSNTRLVSGPVFELYPNPANDLCFAQWGETLESAQIINGLGQIVQSLELNPEQRQLTFSVKSLPPGFYHVVLKGKAGSQSLRTLIKN